MRVRLGAIACYLVAWCASGGLAQDANESQELAEYLASLPSCAVSENGEEDRTRPGIQADYDLSQQVVCLAQEVPRSSCSPDDKACMCDNAELKRAVEACVLAGCHVRETLSTTPPRSSPSEPRPTDIRRFRSYP